MLGILIVLYGVVGSERTIKRVWDISQQANLSGKPQRGRFTEKDTLFLCLLRLSIILDKISYHDFFGIMTFYQECCICTISSKKGRDNMGDFSSIYKFF